MKISDYQKVSVAGRTRVASTVTWEDCDRPARQIFVETDEYFGVDIEPDPNAFLLAAIMPALQHREERIFVEGEVCPELRNGLLAVMHLFSHWYAAGKLVPVTIEASRGFVPPTATVSRAASFLSGGVDALSTLRTNRLDFPESHANYIRDCFFVHGFDVGGYVGLNSNYENSETAVASLSKFATKTGVELIPISTNIRHLDDSDALFYYTFHGAALAAVAHTFSKRISTISIASGEGVHDLSAAGSHPLVDPNYSSCRLRVRHDGSAFTRLDKIRTLSSWPDAMMTLRSCFDAFRGGSDLNCGRCEKCLRTMTELYLVGKLGDAPTYGRDNITVEMLDALQVPGAVPKPGVSREADLKRKFVSLSPGNRLYWGEVIEPLRRMGRNDLADVVAAKVARYDEVVGGHGGFRHIASEFDRRYLKSVLSRVKRRAMVWSKT